MTVIILPLRTEADKNQGRFSHVCDVCNEEFEGSVISPNTRYLFFPLFAASIFYYEHCKLIIVCHGYLWYSISTILEP